MQKVWVSDEFLLWESHCAGGAIVPEEKWKRSYQIWERADYLIENSQNAFDLGDGIANLKRSLNHRLQLIEQCYHLREVDFPGKQKGTLELLEQYGMARPLILKKLMLIRNDIEHNDAPPPDLARCRELQDAIWYFLKSTDAFVQVLKEYVEFECSGGGASETRYGCTIDFDFEDMSAFRISGWFPEGMIWLHETEQCFCVEAEAFNGKEKFKDTGRHLDKLETDRWACGRVFQDGSRGWHRALKTALNSY